MFAIFAPNRNRAISRTDAVQQMKIEKKQEQQQRRWRHQYCLSTPNR